MNSKLGNLTKPAPRIWCSKAVPKQHNLRKLGDAGSIKGGDAGEVKNQMLSSFVYNLGLL